MDRLSVTSRKMVTYTRVDCVGASKVIFEYKAFSKIFLCEPRYFYLLNYNQLGALIWYWDHLKNFIEEIPQGPLGMSIGTIWVTQKRSQGPPARVF